MKPRGRPQKVRIIENKPKIEQFSPRGKPGRPDEVQLNLDQYEAMKLADFNGLDQVDGAKKMGISRASFGRILREARARVSDAIINGKIIRIFGGKVAVRLKNYAD